MKLRALVEGLPLTSLVDGDVDVRAVVTDSREAAPGALFFAREGWFVDSHRFIPDAIDAGACAVVVTRPDAVDPAWGVPVLLSTAEDRDLGLLCDRFFDEPTRRLLVYGVTGTNGKTSVSFLLEHLLRALGERPAVIGTVTHRFESLEIPARNTTPDGLTIHGFARRALDAGATCLIVEVSSHGAHLGRIAGVAFDSVGFTNLTPDHLDYHGTLEAYFEAKALLFGPVLGASVERGKTVFATAWCEDPAGPRMLERAAQHGAVLRIDAGPQAPVPPGTLRVAVDERLGAAGVRVAVRTGGASWTGTVPLVGDHNVANVGVALGMVARTHAGRVGDALAALANFAGVPGRLEAAYAADLGPSCLVDYAHTPDAVARACDVIAALADQTGTQATVVLGCGGDRDTSKRGPMAAAAAERAERVVLTNDNPRSEPPSAILDAMQAGIPTGSRAHVLRIEDRAQAIATALVQARGPVLIAGKGHEAYQEIAGRRFHFDDREEARRALMARNTGVAYDAVPLLSGWPVERIAREMGGRVAAVGVRRPWGALTTDSRTVTEGSLFVALRGERFDAHDFVPACVAAGAALLVVDREVDAPTEVAVVRVDDTIGAFQRLASGLLREARARKGGLRVVGITGSNGKTSTKEMVGTLLGPAALVTPGNLNNHIGLPITVAAIAPRHRFAVLEMGANGPADISELAAIARPDVGVVTSIGLAHVEGFGSLDGVRAAKSGIAASGLETLLIPASEAAHPAWTRAAERCGAVVTFGAASADISVARPEIDGPVSVAGPFGALTLELPLPGIHNATNLGAALGAIRALGAPVDLAAAGAALAGIRLPAGRLRTLRIGGRTLIDDAYNANPASMEASLGILRSCGAPRWAVLGEMRELGPSSDTLHAEVGRVAASSADVVVVVGDAAAPIATGAGRDARHFASLERAAAWVGANAPAGATVLLKASRGAGLEAMIPTLRTAWEGSD